VSTLQAWLVVGVPALGLALILFARRGAMRSALGYVVLVGGFLAMVLLDRVSGAVFGAVLALLYASGRGGRFESGPPAGAFGGDTRTADERSGVAARD
jgi:hypothetical protein